MGFFVGMHAYIHADGVSKYTFSAAYRARQTPNKTKTALNTEHLSLMPRSGLFTRLFGIVNLFFQSRDIQVFFEYCLRFLRRRDLVMMSHQTSLGAGQPNLQAMKRLFETLYAIC